MTLAEIAENLRWAADNEVNTLHAMRGLVMRATADTAPAFARVIERQERRAQAIGMAYALMRDWQAVGEMPAGVATAMEKNGVVA